MQTQKTEIKSIKWVTETTYKSWSQWWQVQQYKWRRQRSL